MATTEPGGILPAVPDGNMKVMRPEQLLLNLLACASTGPMKVGLHSEFAREVYAPPAGSEPVAVFACEADAKAYAALANTGKALAGVVRAARFIGHARRKFEAGEYTADVLAQRLADAEIEIRDSLADLDTVEVL